VTWPAVSSTIRVRRTAPTKASAPAHVPLALVLRHPVRLQYRQIPIQARGPAGGMTALLHRLGFVYKKPKVVPGLKGYGSFLRKQFSITDTTNRLTSFAMRGKTSSETQAGAKPTCVHC
jgi:hypothetical protein